MTKSIHFYLHSFGTWSTHTHQHAQLKERCAVQNSSKIEVISLSSFLQAPQKNFYPFLKKETSTCKCLVGSSDTQCSINHQVVIRHRSPNSDLCGNLISLWREECQTAQREEETQHCFHWILAAHLCRCWRAEYSSLS